MGLFEILSDKEDDFLKILSLLEKLSLNFVGLFFIGASAIALSKLARPPPVDLFERASRLQ